MNFFVLSFDIIDGESGIPKRIVQYNGIIDEQVAISYTSNGSITITDTDEMCPLDRIAIMKSLMKIKDIEKKQIEEATKNR